MLMTPIFPFHISIIALHLCAPVHRSIFTPSIMVPNYMLQNMQIKWHTNNPRLTFLTAVASASSDHITCVSACNKSLAQGGFFSKNSEYFCSEDYQRRHGTRCAVCGQYVEGEVVTALGNTYHQKCFLCARCRYGGRLGARQAAPHSPRYIQLALGIRGKQSAELFVLYFYIRLKF